MMPFRRDRYPANWEEIRQRILARAGQTDKLPARCEKCRIANHAVGYRDEDGQFEPDCGNLLCDAAGQGEDYPEGLLSFGSAQRIADAYNCCTQGKRRCDDEGYHWFVVVLTVSHTDHNPQNNADTNLRALCQSCHLRHDAKLHAANREETRRKRTGQGALIYV